MNAVNFLIDTVFDLYLMIVLLRVWLQLARADFYNPFSQFIVKATQPIVAPLRRFIPGYGGLDIATILFAFVVAAGKVLVLSAVLNYSIDPMVILISALFILITAVFKLLFWVLVIRAILSWVSKGQNPIEAARFGCKVLHGPSVWNFDEIYDLLKRYNVSDKVINPNQLSYKVDKMLNNKNKHKNLELKIKNLGNKILTSTLNEVNIYINK